MSRIGRSAVRAACQTPEQMRVQRQRQLLQRIRQNLSEARYDSTYETSDTLLQMQEQLMKRMQAEGKMDQPDKTDEEIEEECTKSASDTLLQMKKALASKRKGDDKDMEPAQRGRTASVPTVHAPLESRHSMPSTSMQTGDLMQPTSGVTMAVAEVHAVQDADD